MSVNIVVEEAGVTVTLLQMLKHENKNLKEATQVYVNQSKLWRKSASGKNKNQMVKIFHFIEIKYSENN